MKYKSLSVESLLRSIVLVVTVLSAACTDRRSLVAPVPPGLLNSPATISVNGTPVVMNEVFVTTDGRRGVGVLGLLQTTNGTSLSGVLVETLWLIRGEQAWRTTATRVPDPLPPDIIEKFVAGAGPQWPLGNSVDVVVEVRESSGATQLLRGPRTTIGPADPVSSAGKDPGERFAVTATAAPAKNRS